MQASIDNLAPIFCKPSSDSPEVLFSKFSSDLGGYISFRSFDMAKDIDLIYEWVNSSYATQFWKMNGPKDNLIETYTSIISCSHAHSFVGLLGNERVCQIDVYRVLADELCNHVSANPEDCGMHLLMAPNDKSVGGLTRKVVTAFLKFYFSFPVAQTMYGEPDTNNYKAKKILDSLGFKYQSEATLSYKTASIYKITRRSFSSSLL
jgi:hypothetical protein